MKHLSTVLVILFITTVLIMGALEVIYRFQIIDTYKPELRVFNPESIFTDNERPTILLLGDSFTAGIQSYPATLRKHLDGYRVINSGISGTGINEALLIAPRRFKDFKPSIFIYQIYVGNDLMNIRYPVNWQTLSLPRNLYWTLIQYTKSLAYLNYRLTHVIGASPDLNMQKKVPEEFSLDKYTNRWRLYLRGDPAIIEHQILVTDAYKLEYEYLLVHLKELLKFCKPVDCKAYVLVIPHAAQVNSKYLKNQVDLGANFSNLDAIGETEYPFIKGIRSSLAGNNNVTVLNPLEHLQHMENEKMAVYYPNDPHLNSVGQEEIGDFLLDRIKLDAAL